MSPGQPLSGLEIVRKATRYVRPFSGRFAIKAAFIMLSLLPMLIVPWPVKMIVDNVVLKQPIADAERPYPFFIQPLIHVLEGRDPYQILMVLVALQFGLFLLAGSFGTAGGQSDSAEANLAQGHDTATRTEAEANSGWSFAGGLLGLVDFRFTLKLSQAINHYYRSKLFERVQQLPITTFADERIGDAVYRVMYDTPAITNAAYRILLTPVTSPLVILLTTWIIWLTYGPQPHLLAASLAMIPAAFFGSLPLVASVRRGSQASREAGSKTTSTTEEGISNMLAVQSLGGEDRQRTRFDDDSWESFGQFRRLLLLQIAGLIAAIVPVAVIWVWAFFRICDDVIAKTLTLGDFSLLIVYYGRLVTPAVILGMTWFRVQEAAAGIERVFFLMDLPNEADDAGTRTLEAVREGVRLEGVSYAYPDGTPALEGVDADFPVGRMIALAGPAGAGKTTVASMLPRFLTPTEGRMTIDGVDAREFSLASLRERTAFVFQETQLFDGTVADNMRIAKPDATPIEIARALRLAGASEFVERLPQGIDTPLGQRGGKLSVGQKQRLSIARALVRDASILVLDEPTSALDPRTEAQLVETLHHARAGRLVVVIAHRLSTIRAADEICFIDDGRIVERGSHEALMALPDGRYRRFTELQSRGAA